MNHVLILRQNLYQGQVIHSCWNCYFSSMNSEAPSPIRVLSIQKPKNEIRAVLKPSASFSESLSPPKRAFNILSASSSGYHVIHGVIKTVVACDTAHAVKEINACDLSAPLSWGESCYFYSRRIRELVDIVRKTLICLCS